MMMAAGTKAITPSPKKPSSIRLLPAPAEPAAAPRRAAKLRVVVPESRRRRHHDGERVVRDASAGRLCSGRRRRADEGVLGPLPQPSCACPTCRSTRAKEIAAISPRRSRGGAGRAGTASAGRATTALAAAPGRLRRLRFRPRGRIAPAGVRVGFSWGGGDQFRPRRLPPSTMRAPALTSPSPRSCATRRAASLTTRARTTAGGRRARAASYARDRGRGSARARVVVCARGERRAVLAQRGLRARRAPRRPRARSSTRRSFSLGSVAHVSVGATRSSSRTRTFVAPAVGKAPPARAGRARRRRRVAACGNQPVSSPPTVAGRVLVSSRTAPSPARPPSSRANAARRRAAASSTASSSEPSLARPASGTCNANVAGPGRGRAVDGAGRVLIYGRPRLPSQRVVRRDARPGTQPAITKCVVLAPHARVAATTGTQPASRRRPCRRRRAAV